MIKKLQRRLRIFFIFIFMTVVTIILCFSLWNTWQAQKNADVIYIQRMASLITYQLEATPARALDILESYEKKTGVYSLLKNGEGHTLYKSRESTRTDLDTLAAAVDKMTATVSLEQNGGSGVTVQGGYEEIFGNHQEGYYVIPSQIHPRSGGTLSLLLFYPEPSPAAFFLRQALGILLLWLCAFICVFFVSRFLLNLAFKPTFEMLQGQKDFVAAASHELKSPLAVIMANTENIQNMAQRDSRMQPHLEVIDRECNRMAKLVKDMLLLVSSDSDRWTFTPREVNTDTLLITLYDAYAPLCRQKSIVLDLCLGEESYPGLLTDQERLFQILSIFLDNAVSYSSEGGTVNIEADFTAKEMTFRVIDHGRGISDPEKALVFNRFYRGDKSRTDKSHFGLGLSIAKELAAILSAKIGVTDTPGGGATFFLTLPL